MKCSRTDFCSTHILPDQASRRDALLLRQIDKDKFVRKALRFLGVSLALVALLVFATGVVSDWHHDSSTNDAQCPYCHLGHQTPLQPETPLCVAVLNPVATIILAEDARSARRPCFLPDLSPRAARRVNKKISP